MRHDENYFQNRIAAYFNRLYQSVMNIYNKPKVKICGLSEIKTLQTALDNGADMIGLIFFPKSPRHVSFENAAQLAQYARGKAQIVAVTVDADDTLLKQIMSHVAPDILQLHGHETIERVAYVKNLFNIPIIKAFSIQESSDFIPIKDYKNIADYLLLDAKAPKNADLPGGNGISFDWSLLKHRDSNFEYILSGGLTPFNIAQALHETKASMVDVSSGVESRSGVKDSQLINDFFDAIHKGTE
jgi:phosphoribosylanthranilate isomerase